MGESQEILVRQVTRKPAKMVSLAGFRKEFERCYWSHQYTERDQKSCTESCLLRHTETEFFDFQVEGLDADAKKFRASGSVEVVLT